MIHQYKNNGYNIVMDVNSGCVHVVDDIVYNIIPVVEGLLKENMDKDLIRAAVLSMEDIAYDGEQVSEALDEIFELKDNDMLFTEDEYEGYIDAFRDGGEGTVSSYRT